MSESLNENSIVMWNLSDANEELEGHKCGYCKSPNGSISQGMFARKLTVEDYQNLIDRGWRRSGCYCYKPINDKSCCVLYTIRCEALNFHTSKSQKKIIKKVNKYKKDGILVPCTENSNKDEEQSSEMFVLSNFSRKQPDLDKLSCFSLNENVSGNLSEKTTAEPGPSNQITAESHIKSVLQPKSGLGADSSKPPCKKAKFLRAERKQARLEKRGMGLDPPKIQKNEQKRLEDFLNEEIIEGKHHIRLELIHNEDLYLEKMQEEYVLYKKYQMIIHNDPPSKCTIQGFERFLIQSPLQIDLDRLSLAHEKFNESFNLYKKYQKIIHGDEDADLNKESFNDFLIETPLLFKPFSEDSRQGFGTFHQLYWLDDKLIAVGVIDILPKCISSVYFFYDPDYRNLSLGTYGTLREIEFTRQLHAEAPSIQYYYMGFYIHSCVKMRYKGKYSPSFLLCPETYNWISIEKCLPKIELSKYSRLVDDLNALMVNSCEQRSIKKMQLIINNRLMRVKDYLDKYEGQLEQFEKIGELVGSLCANKIVFVLY